MTPSYWFVARPKNVEHQHPFLVFDTQDRLHLPLTRFAKEQKLYPFANPLVDSMSATIAAAIAHVEREDSEQKPPRMPAKSGVEAPQKKPERRLTDSYYKLERDEWHPQIIDDPKLPGDILAGGGSSRSSTQGSAMKWSLCVRKTINSPLLTHKSASSLSLNG